MSRTKGSVTKGPAYFPAAPLVEAAKGLRDIASGYLKERDAAEAVDAMCREWLRLRSES